MLRLLNKWSDRIYAARNGLSAIMVESGYLHVKVRKRGARDLTVTYPLTISDSGQVVIEGLGERSVIAGTLCRVLVPDPECYVRLVEFSELPKNEFKARQFLQWKLEKELLDASGKYEIALGPIKRKAGVCSSLIVKQTLVRAVGDILGQLQAVPASMMPSSFYVHAYLRQRAQRHYDQPIPSVLIQVGLQGWSILVTRLDGQICLLRSCLWSGDQVDDSDIVDIYSDCLRINRRYGRNALTDGIALLGEGPMVARVLECAHRHDLSFAVMDPDGWIAPQEGQYNLHLLDVVLNSEH